MNEKFKFDSSARIMVKTYYGPITLDDITNSWEYAFEKGMIPKETKGFILDLRKASYGMDLDENELLVEFYQKHLEVFRNCKIAIITSRPADIVIPILFAESDKEYTSRAFSTLQAAEDWVKL